MLSRPSRDLARSSTSPSNFGVSCHPGPYYHIAKELDLHGQAGLSARWPRIASAREIRRSPGRDNGISAAAEWQADTRKVPGVRLVHRLASHRFVCLCWRLTLSLLSAWDVRIMLRDLMLVITPELKRWHMECSVNM